MSPRKGRFGPDTNAGAERSAMRVAVLITWRPTSPFRFSEELAGLSTWTVDTIGGLFPKRRTLLWKAVVVWPMYTLVPLLFLARIRRYDHVICWQQAYGIVLGCLLRISPFRVASRVHIMTLIVVPGKRRGAWLRIIRFALASKNVASVVVHNEAELALYRALFPQSAEKFRYVTYTAADVVGIDSLQICDDDFFLAAGRSNRDNDFLIRYFAIRPNRRLVILTDVLPEKGTPANVTVLVGRYGRDYFEVLARCHAVVMVFEDPTISAGQLVFLQALQLGKPVVATYSSCLQGYLHDGSNGLMVPKSEEGLDNGFRQLDEAATYARLAERGPRDYEERFGFRRLATEMFKVLVHSG